MVLPLIPLLLIGTGATTGITGGVNGVMGGSKMREAAETGKRTQEEYERSVRRAQNAATRTNKRVATHGERQVQAQSTVIRMAEWLKRHERQVAESVPLLMDGLEVEIHEVAELGSLVPGGLELLTEIFKSGATGVAVATGIPTAVTGLATASTGVAISGLTGVAAESATLAWLGGGSLAAGGGGMVLGATALNFVTIGPSLLVGGLLLNGKGEKALTSANAYKAEVAVAVANHRKFETVLKAVDLRVAELRDILLTLVERAERAFVELDALEFDPVRDVEAFQLALTLAVATKDVINTPVLDEEGALNGDTERIVITYKEHRDA
jgi:hypothetical protein